MTASIDVLEQPTGHELAVEIVARARAIHRNSANFIVTPPVMSSASFFLVTEKVMEGRLMTTVYADMCGDLFHFGHVRFLRVARGIGDRLVVGISNQRVSAPERSQLAGSTACGYARARFAIAQYPSRGDPRPTAIRKPGNVT